jgi:phosphoglycerol transferase
MPRNPVSLLLIFCFFVFLFFILRNSGLYPSVFHDEYTHSRAARLLPFNQSPIPGYLYLWIYSFTNYCGNGYLGCARILNALFFVSGAIFIFLIARKILPDFLAVLTTIFSILSPLVVYTTFFTPESCYFLGFWIFAWRLIGLKPDSRNHEWLLAGFLYGCMSLVKPHALLLAPAIAIYIFYIFLEKQGCCVVSIIKPVGLLFSAAAVVKFPAACLFAGKSGLTIFGTFYSEFADKALLEPDAYLKLLDFASLSFFGHAMAITLLYGVPFFITVLVVFDHIRNRDAERTSLNRISMFTILVVLNLVLVTVIFTAVASVWGENEYQLHMRYYNFALPLFYIVAGGAMTAKPGKKNLFFYVLLVLQIGIVCHAVYMRMYPFSNRIDFFPTPELYSIHLDKFVFYIFGTLSIFTFGLCFWRVDLGARIYFFLVVPFLVGSSFNMVEVTRSKFLASRVADRAGLFAKDYLSKEDRNKLVIIGPYRRTLFRAAFHVNSAGASIDTQWPYDFSRPTPGKEWFLLVGHPIPPDIFFCELLAMDRFTLARIGTSCQIDFNRRIWPAVVRQIRGSFGAGRTVDKLGIEFAAPLPVKFELAILARSAESGTEKTFVAKVGNAARPFVLKSGVDERVVLKFDNAARSNILSVEAFQPSLTDSLSSDGGGAMPRFELSKLEIRPL